MNLNLVKKYYESEEYLNKLRARVQILQECESNEFLRQKWILERFSVDPILFIETFCFTKLTKLDGEMKPFFLFDYQKDMILKFLAAENDNRDHRIVVDKPREMGASWVILAYMYWRWLFKPGWSGFVLSRSSAEVDDGSRLPDKSLFGKLRWMIDNTPAWLLSEDYSPKGKKGTNTDSELKLINPTMQSSLIGSTTNTNVGRSGRFSLVFIDECFFIENFLTVINSLNTVSKTQIFASTAVPGLTPKKFIEAQAEKGDHLSLTVEMHPWKDQEWVNEKRAEGEWNPEALREIEVSYSIPKESQYYPQISEAKFKSFQYNPAKPLYLSLDTGRSDFTVLIWWQYYDSQFWVLECAYNTNKALDWYIPFLDPGVEFNPDNYRGFYFSLLEKARKFKRGTYFFGEAAHLMKQMPTNRSIADELYKLAKIRLTVNNYAVKHEPRRIGTSQILPLTVFNEDSETVRELYDAILNSRYTNSVSPTSKETTMKPVHDKKIADMRAAFENGAVNIPRIIRHQRTESRSPKMDDVVDRITKYLRV